MTRHWMRLDNAAKIYPASRSRRWTALFRVAMTLDAPVDPQVLQQAQNRAMRRVAGFSYVLKKGLFWYYLEEGTAENPVRPDVNNPCAPFHPEDNGGYCFRVRYYENRIAVEIFHALTDGTGGMLFLKTLVAEYLRLRDGLAIPFGDGILDCDEPPASEELEDGFLKNVGVYGSSRAEPSAYHIGGEVEPFDRVQITCGQLPLAQVAARASAMQVSITEYLTGVLLLAVDQVQRQNVRNPRRYKPVKINVPVNLRPLFDSRTHRNFASYVTPGIDPRLGEYELPEVCRIVHHAMGAAVTKKAMTAKFTTNVRTEQNGFLRITPLFLKSAVMKSVFSVVGDRKSSTSLSNLGLVRLPAEMEKHVENVEFLLGPLSYNRVAFAAAGYRGTLTVNVTRNMKNAETERLFFTSLVRQGIPVRISSNARED